MGRRAYLTYRSDIWVLLAGLAPDEDDAIERAVRDVLDPYDRARDVALISRRCDCVTLGSIDAARDALRDTHAPLYDEIRLLRGQPHSWDRWERVHDRILAEEAAYATLHRIPPRTNCSTCDGSGIEHYRGNPDGHFDDWMFNTDGAPYIPEEDSCASIASMFAYRGLDVSIERQVAVIAADGSWHWREDSTQWQKDVRALLRAADPGTLCRIAIINDS